MIVNRAATVLWLGPQPVFRRVGYHHSSIKPRCVRDEREQNLRRALDDRDHVRRISARVDEARHRLTLLRAELRAQGRKRHRQLARTRRRQIVLRIRYPSEPQWNFAVFTGDRITVFNLVNDRTETAVDEK